MFVRSGRSSVLPCSRVLLRTMSSKFSSSNILKRARIRTRSTGGVSIHEGKATCAASTAAFASATFPTGHSEITSPMDGLKTGVRAVLDSIHSPPMKLGHGSSIIHLFLKDSDTDLVLKRIIGFQVKVLVACLEMKINQRAQKIPFDNKTRSPLLMQQLHLRHFEDFLCHNCRVAGVSLNCNFATNRDFDLLANCSKDLIPIHI